MARIITGDRMVDSVRKRTMCPDDTSIFTDVDILDILDEEMNVQVLDKLVRLHGENLTISVDIPRNASGSYSIPNRALGNKLRDVSLVNGNTIYEMSQISIGELPDYSNYSEPYTQLDLFYIENNKIKLVTATRSYDSIRMRYYLRPNFLTKVEEAGIVNSITTNTVAGTITLSMSQIGKNFTDSDKYDIIGKETPNKIKSMDLTAVSLTTGGTGNIVFNIADIGEYLDDIEVGDYISLAGETPVPNIPTEMHPLLAQAAAIQLLEALGDTEALQNAIARMDKMVTAVQTLIDARVELAPKKIKPRNGTLSQVGFGRTKRRGR